jgi:8-oxo-dGTP pyrophosphatase MutT (NUDIX family)
MGLRYIISTPFFYWQEKEIMTDYVLIHAQPVEFESHSFVDWYSDIDIPVLIIEKQNPPWQRNKLNLVGGHIEPGEEPLAAAQREFEEEAGKNKKEHLPVQMGILTGTWGNIYLFKKFVDVDFYPHGEEKVFWTKWNRIKSDVRLMPNLRVIIPLLAMGLKNWVVTDNGETWGQEKHLISVEIQGTPAVIEN